jgi:hypothetical protein
MADPNPWAWREGRNPYRSTPFQVLDLPLDVRGRGAVKARVEKRRRRIASAPTRYPMFGKVLSEADVNAAEKEILDPESRLLAELRTHRPRRARLDLAGIADQLPASLSWALEDRPPVRLDRSRLLALVPQLPERRFPSVLPW